MYRAETPYGVVTLPPLELISLAVIKAAQAADPQERFWVLIESIADTDTIDILDQLPGTEIEKLYTPWEAEAEVTLGELFNIATILGNAGHRESLEADLIDKGLRLRHCPSADFTWHDLKVIIQHLSVTSNLFRSMHPDHAGWTLEAMLLADQVDSLHWLQWSKTKDGIKGRNKPKRVPRPGITQPTDRKQMPGKAVPLSVLKKRMAETHGAEAPAIRNKKLKQLFGGR
jgi:hypothetical protein